MSKNVRFDRPVYTPDKPRDEFAKEYNAKLIIPPQTLAAREKYIGICNWHEGDGPTELVFAGRPRGHKCFWTARWSCRGGMWQVNQGFALDQMSVPMLLAECQDEIYRDPQSSAITGLTSSYMDWTTEAVASYSYLLDQIIDILQKRRPAYGEYTAWWDIPERIAGGFCLDRQRPGWPAPVRENVSYYTG